MASSNCNCGDGKLGNLGRPKCVTEMGTIAFPILFPRYDATGARNTFDLSSATLGQDILDLVQADSSTFRIYPFSKVENVTTDRTDTVYETFPSGRKVRIDGVGGIRTFGMELIGKDGVNGILRELKKNGCTDMDFVLADVNGNLWLQKDDELSTTGTGWKMDSETFDAFKVYATDTTSAKIMVSFDLARYEKEENGYVITASELGYPATDLQGLVAGTQVATPLTTTTIRVKVYDNYGSAVTNNPVTGLLNANFVLKNTTTPATVTTTTSETADGDYTLTFTAQTGGDAGTVEVFANGYDFNVETIEFL